jgi:hypothetical protein
VQVQVQERLRGLSAGDSLSSNSREGAGSCSSGRERATSSLDPPGDSDKPMNLPDVLPLQNSEHQHANASRIPSAAAGVSCEPNKTPWFLRRRPLGPTETHDSIDPP